MCAACLSILIALADPASRLADTYADAVRKINEAHARKPAGQREADLAKRLPKKARAALDRLLRADDSAATRAALVVAGEAALDLDLIDDFGRVKKRLAKLSKVDADRLGGAVSRPRFLLRGLGGLDDKYLKSFAEVFDGILDAYDKEFGFAEWSKVPGKKLRVRVHLEKRITRPPHFAPQFPFHSEIDFPVVDPETLSSPTRDGKFLFYGLCHELGHVVAMWGDRTNEEDHHAWAHYTGVAIVEALSKSSRPYMKRLKDVRWRSLAKEKERLRKTAPSTADRDGVLALFIALHDTVGPKAIGAALNYLDEEDRRRRINRVRYYTFEDLRRGFRKTLKGKKDRSRVDKLLR
ncbi:MAG: carbon-nitrogen hydrolase family protein [Planctomycetota bacterium]|jgi:hypothetical protein